MAITIKDMVVKAGEKVSRTKNIDTGKRTVRLVNVSRNDTTKQNYKVDWTFDFAECTDAEMLDLAARSAVIAYRKNFRGVSAEDIPKYAERTINVKDILTSERKVRDPKSTAIKLLKDMTDEEREEVLKELGIEE